MGEALLQFVEEAASLVSVRLDDGLFHCGLERLPVRPCMLVALVLVAALVLIARSQAHARTSR